MAIGLRSFLVPLLLLFWCRPSESSLEHGVWDYKARGPRVWPDLFKQFCAGRKQSPIDLGVTTSMHDPLLREFTTRMDEMNKFTLRLENDGHKLQLTIGANLRIRIGDEQTMYYTAEQLHWHWGADNSRGSEHTVAGRKYPLEGHLVFWNSYDYSNFSKAVHNVGGLAVLGVLYELSKDDNPFLKAMEPHIPDLVKSGSKVDVTFSSSDFDFINSYLPKSTREFYRYEGSLTTPTCNENVLWTVFAQPAPVSARQLNLLRTLLYPDGKPCVDNFRPVQPLNPPTRPGANRVVYRTFDRDGGVFNSGSRAASGSDTSGVAGGPFIAPALTAAALAIGCMMRNWAY